MIAFQRKAKRRVPTHVKAVAVGLRLSGWKPPKVLEVLVKMGYAVDVATLWRWKKQAEAQGLRADPLLGATARRFGDLTSAGIEDWLKALGVAQELAERYQHLGPEQLANLALLQQYADDSGQGFFADFTRFLGQYWESLERLPSSVEPRSRRERIEQIRAAIGTLVKMGVDPDIIRDGYRLWEKEAKQ